METRKEGTVDNKTKSSTQKRQYDAVRSKATTITEGMDHLEMGSSSSRGSGHDILRAASLESQREEKIRELGHSNHIDATIDRHGKTASTVLRRCYVQGLQEERFIHSMLDRLKLCPEEVKGPISSVLFDHLPQDNTGQIQTVSLFEWGRDYTMKLYTSKTPELRQYLDSPQLHPDTALDAALHVQAVRNEIIDEPHRFLRLEETEGATAQQREATLMIDNGCALSLESWDDHREGRIEDFHALMHKEYWPEGSSDIWQIDPEELPQIRTKLDLSSLQLAHQGHAVQSLEVLKYMGSTGEDHPSSPTGEGVHYKNSEEKWHITSKLTTSGGDYFTPITEIQHDESQDAGEHAQHLVEPFLSGREQDTVNTVLRQGDILPENYWRNENANWRLIAGQRQKYHESLHPAIDQYAQGEIADQRERGAERTVILDVAGGNGDLAERIIKNAHKNFPEHPIDYILIDGSNPDITLANERFGTLVSSLGAQHITARAIEVDLRQYRPGPMASEQNLPHEYRSHAEAMKQDLHLPSEGVNLVLNSGGILNRGITNDAGEAANYLGVLTHMMKPGEGSGIYSGLTPLRITVDTHAKIGGTDIHNLTDPYSSRQAHVVRRALSRDHGES